jgi:hypothetical protein
MKLIIEFYVIENILKKRSFGLFYHSFSFKKVIFAIQFWRYFMKFLKFSFGVSVILFVFLFTQSAFCQKPFSGIIKYKVTDKEDGISYINYCSKPGKIRVEVESKKKDNDDVFIIINSRKKEMSILESNEKVAISIPLEGMDDKKEEKDKHEHKYNITKTDEVKTIHGYKAIKYIGKNKDEVVELWVTEEIDPSSGLGNKSSEILGWQDITGMDVKGFPLEMYNKTKGSGIVATSIEEKSLDDSFFKVPSNYKHYNLKSFLKGMKILAKDLGNLFKDFKLENFEE